MAITFRLLTGSALTHEQMDTNLGSYFLSSSISGSILTFYQSSSADGSVISSSLDISSADTDDQTLSISQSNLSISEGNTVSLSNIYNQGKGIELLSDTISFRNADNLTNTVLPKWDIASASLVDSIIRTTSTKAFITGALYLTGSEVNFRMPWPTLGSETHFIELDAYTNGGRSYEYSAFAIENYEGIPDRFNNIFTVYTRDSESNNYGTELTVGPVRVGMFVNPSGSNSYGNISVEEVTDGETVALLYANEIQIGAYTGDLILIGNTGSVTDITGSLNIASDAHFYGPIHDSLDSPGTNGYVLSTTVSGSVWIPNTDNTGSVNDALITLSASNGIVGGGSFTTDQATPDTISFTLTPGVVSGSSQITLQDTTGNLSGSRIDGAVALATTANTASYVLGNNVDGPVALATTANTASYIMGNNVHGPVASAVTAVSASYAVTASHALNLKDGIDIVINSGSFNYITATTASFGFINYITGSATLIGDAFVVVNSNSPTQRYSGLATYDSGSTNVTASFFFDSITNDWNYEYDNMGTVDYGVAMFGPEYNVQGTPVYNTNNRLVKADGGHHLLDSNISDNGTTVQVYSNIIVTGSVSGSTYYGDGSNLTGIAGTTYSAGTGLNLVGTTFNNTSPDQTVAITGQNITVNGVYPNFQLTGSTDTTYSAGTGLSLVGTTFNNTAPDQTVSLTQGGATVITGTYPSFTISSTDTTYTNVSELVNDAGYITGYTETDTLQTVTTRGATTTTTITAANFITTSDRRLKSDIEPLKDGLDTIKKFVSYEYTKGGVQDAGFMAQEVQEAIPYAIAEGEDGFLTMRDRPVLAYMHKAILELEARLAAIEEKLG